MPLKTFTFQDFRGLNRTSDRLNSPVGFLYDLLNGYIKKDVKSNQGIIQQRDGASKVNSVSLNTIDYGTTSRIRYIYEAKWDGGSTDLIIRAGTAWGKYDNTDSFDTIDSGRTDDALGQCVMFQNELIMVDGAKARKMTSAAVVSNLSADANLPANSDAVWVHRDKVWINDTNNPMIAYFCKTNSANGATAWTGSTDAGTIDLRTILPDGDRIRGYRTYGGTDSGMIAIICDKYTVIFAAGANAYTFTFMQYFPTSCISINATDYVGNDLVYPSRHSLTSLLSSITNAQLETKPLSNYIVNLYRDLVKLVSDTTHISGVFGHKLNHYYLAFPVSGNSQILVYSVDIGNFVGRFVYPWMIYGMCERRNFDILVGSDNFVYKINDTAIAQDSGTGVEFRARFPALYFDSPDLYKRPRQFEGLIQSDGNIDFDIDYWYGLTALASDKVTKTLSISSSQSLWNVALWDVSYWDTQGNQIVKTSDLLGRGKMMFLELSHNNSGSKIAIMWFVLRIIKEGVN